MNIHTNSISLKYIHTSDPLPIQINHNHNRYLQNQKNHRTMNISHLSLLNPLFPWSISTPFYVLFYNEIRMNSLFYLFFFLLVYITSSRKIEIPPFDQISTETIKDFIHVYILFKTSKQLWYSIKIDTIRISIRN